MSAKWAFRVPTLVELFVELGARKAKSPTKVGTLNAHLAERLPSRSKRNIITRQNHGDHTSELRLALVFIRS